MDEKGQPVEGVTITVKGTSKATSTNSNGEFLLSDVDENALLVLTSTNIDRLELRIEGRRELAIGVKSKASILDEVQVIPYGTQTRRFSVGNVSTVKSSVLENQPVTNPLLALQGRVPGLFIAQYTGVANGAVNLKLQGQNTIRGGTQPLILIDGVPYLSELGYDGGIYGGSNPRGANALSFINPNDIESIDVLKDADATAIYGSRAANGAILITTKKGKVGKTSVDINLQQGWGKVTRKIDMLNTRQYLDMRYEAISNDGLAIEGEGNYDLIFWDTTRYTDWQKVLIGNTARYTNINASASGGNAITQYLLGATFNRTTTVYPGNFDDRRGSVHFDFRGNSSNQKFKVRLSGSYLVDDNQSPNFDITQQALLLEPVAPSLYDSLGKLNWAPTAGGSPSWDNPLVYIHYQDFNNMSKNLFSNAQLNYTVLPGLDIKTSLGYSALQTNTYSRIPLEGIRPDWRPFTERQSDFRFRTNSSWIIEPQISYEKNIQKLGIQLLVGTTIQKSNEDYLGLTSKGQTSDLLLNQIGGGTSTDVTSSSHVFRYNALFSRFNLNWNNKYIMSLTARRDGSSRFGENNQFNNFGSTGVGWIFSEESFVKKALHALSFGKLKMSVGTTGNDQVGNSDLSYYGISNPAVPYQGAGSLRVLNIPNPNLQWEETRKLQGGIELGFFNDRILLNAMYAHNTSSNLLLSFILPSVTGFSTIIENFPATIRNTSIEISLNATLLKYRDYSWTFNANLTVPRNKVVSFPNIELTSYGTGKQGVIVGQPLGVQKVFHGIGIDPIAGTSLIADSVGNATSSPNFNTDQNTIVNTLPRFYGGLQSTFTWKSITIDVFFHYVRQFGNTDIYYGYFPPGTFSKGYSNQPVTVLDRWRKPGDETLITRYNSDFTVFNYLGLSDLAYSYDASYLRLKNVAVSWQVPMDWLQRIHLQSAKIYFQGQNLATFTRYSGLDPETMSSFVLPPLRMWTVGANISF